MGFLGAEVDIPASHVCSGQAEASRLSMSVSFPSKTLSVGGLEPGSLRLSVGC